MSDQWAEVPQPTIVRDCRVCFPDGRTGDCCLVSPQGVAHEMEDQLAPQGTFCGHDATGDNWWWPWWPL